MGHKGRIIGCIEEAVGSVLRKGSRICDPFCGSAAVSWHLASRFSNPVWSGDLQAFAVARAAAVVTRVDTPSNRQLDEWLKRTTELVASLSDGLNGASLPLPESWSGRTAKKVVQEHRESAEAFRIPVRSDVRPIVTHAYGGHYFSAPQAMAFDAMRASIPTHPSARKVALSALVGAASSCSASPGHTAQPFQPTDGASKWLLDAWRRAPQRYIRDEWGQATSIEPKLKGRAIRSDAKDLISKLDEGDVVFLDPPYSGVHYSRFYHVLETLIRGYSGPVEGVGRYPPRSERPASSFSRKSEAARALEELIAIIAHKKLSCVITFPDTKQSNGLSGDAIEDACRSVFRRVDRSAAESTFSTLGGRGKDRGARMAQSEAILVCRQ
jgi:16S rRNA G966 N2-methylase RsmD